MTAAVETLVLERARSGDTEAFRVLVDEHGPALYRLAYRLTGNRQDAEDVVQEAFLRAYRRLGRYETRAQLGAWLQRVATNRAIDLLRRRRRWGLRPIEQDDGGEILRSAEPDPDRRLIGEELSGRLAAVLATLTPAERAAFVLRHFEGRSIAEIVAVTGARPNATKNRIFRAVRKVRRALEPLVDTGEAGHDARR